MGRDCTYCGAYISDGLDACPACGRKVQEPETDSHADANAHSYTSSYGSAAAAQAPGYSDTQQRQTHTEQNYQEAYQRGYEAARAAYAQQEEKKRDDAASSRPLSFLCYLGPLFVIPYFANHDSDFVRFHANQGLLLFLTAAACSIVGLSGIGAFIQFCGVLSGMLAISRGEKKRLPFIGKLQLLR